MVLLISFNKDLLWSKHWRWAARAQALTSFPVYNGSWKSTSRRFDVNQKSFTGHACASKHEHTIRPREEFHIYCSNWASKKKQPPISSIHPEYHNAFERKLFYSKKLCKHGCVKLGLWWPPSHLQTPEWCKCLCFHYSHVKIRHGSLNELVIVKDSSHKRTSSTK